MPNDNVTPTRLYRSRHERVIAGVAGGMGQYFNIDPVIPRLGFVLLALAPHLGFLAFVGYIIMAIAIRERPIGEVEPTIGNRSVYAGRGREFVGYLLVGLGIFFLAGTLGVYNLIHWEYVWPVALIGIGLLVLWRDRD